MATKRPALRALPRMDHVRGRRLERQVTAIVRRHVEEACERAWSDVGESFGARAMLVKNDPATVSARRAVRALTTLLTNGLTRLAVVALLLPCRGTSSRRRRWSGSRPRLTAVPGGRNGHAAADWRPDGSASSS